MNLYAIEASISHYLSDANEQDAAMLTFYQGLWKLMHERAKALEPDFAYTVPDKDAISDVYWNYEPLFMQYPVEIDSKAFAETLGTVAAYFIEHAGLDEATQSGIQDVDWNAFVAASPFDVAKTYPPQYIENILTTPELFGLGADVSISIFGLVVAYALRTHIMLQAEALMRKAPLEVGVQNKHKRPLACPVCGGSSTSGFVGETESSDGMGVELFCPTCGVTWPFERIRCAQCGEQDQGKLHYFNIEGDNAHRLHTCDTCGSYTRMVFQEDIDAKAGLCMDVEDVVMARLDALASDPKFHEQAQPHRPQHG